MKLLWIFKEKSIKNNKSKIIKIRKTWSIGSRLISWRGKSNAPNVREHDKTRCKPNTGSGLNPTNQNISFCQRV